MLDGTFRSGPTCADCSLNRGCDNPKTPRLGASTLLAILLGEGGISSPFCLAHRICAEPGPVIRIPLGASAKVPRKTTNSSNANGTNEFSRPIQSLRTQIVQSPAGVSGRSRHFTSFFWISRSDREATTMAIKKSDWTPTSKVQRDWSRFRQPLDETSEFPGVSEGRSMAKAHEFGFKRQETPG
jgi:hypothetical protein